MKIGRIHEAPNADALGLAAFAIGMILVVISAALELEAIAKGIAELADVLSEAGLAGHAVQADDYAERLRGRAIAGVPEHVDPDETTPQTIDVAALEREPRIGIPDDDDE